MTYAPSYNNDRTTAIVEVEYPTDPASGGFFQSDYKKHDDLKQMLDGSKDSLKLEAMKRIIGMVAKGRDASDLFPAVVKNVVSKNIEVKKLVYVYLERYAEEQQDLALLSISTFQRALKDPNQLIRASALRVLSSIRVEMIVPIVMLAIKDSVSDMSPYVRKTAAHAIPKLYSIDPELKEELVSIIKKLLSERTTIVIGSAVMAFSEVCPERSDLIHPNFRKLCTLLIDVDEWGQLVILNVLTRYARENFCDPNSNGGVQYEDENDRPFYDSEDGANSENSDETNEDKTKKTSVKKKSQINSNALDSDHRLLLRSANPLLQSRNAGVVMAVAQLYYHAGPASDLPQAARALIRLLRGPIEVQSIVLHSIASLTIGKKNMFEPFLKTFFVRTSDPTHIKILKLEILSNLATEATVPTILREFQTYITSSDKSFVAATIQAIDRCAANIKTVTDTCLQGLLDLLSNKDESIVAESVVVIKKLLQSERSVDHKTIIAQMVRLLDHITVGAARAAILWLLGEYRSDRIAPDVLRKCAKTFVQEEDLVKLQVLNLAVKLCLTNPEQTQQLAQYIFTLARYDPSYDIRDRARFLKHFVFPINGGTSKLLQNAKKIFLATKPAPLLESKFKERQQYTLGSLSHYVSGRALGYVPLPQFPLESTPSSIRDSTKVELTDSSHRNIYGEKNVNKLFYSESDESSPAASSSEGESSDGENDNGSEQETNNSESEGKKSKTSSKKNNNVGSSSSNYDSDSTNPNSSNSESESNNESNSEVSESDSESNDASSDSCNSKSENEDNNQKTIENNENSKNVLPKTETKEKTNLDLLLELGEMGDALPIMTPTYGGFLSPISNNPSVMEDSITLVSPSFIPQRSHELLSKISGHGLMILYRFTRSPHLFSSKMASLELLFVNQSNEDITNISINKKGLSADQTIHPFAPIPTLGVGSSQSGIMGIDFNDTSQSAQFFIKSDLAESPVSIKPPVGELIRSVSMTETRFLTEQKKLRGMTQVEGQSEYPGSTTVICQKIVDIANVSPIASQDTTLRFAGQTLSTQCLLLLTIQIINDKTNITVNCEKMVIGSMLLNEIKSCLSK